MTTHANVIVTFKEYPHIDGGLRAEELFSLCLAAHRGETQPVMQVFDCKMINMWRTPEEPMRSLVAEMQALEGKDGVLSVSLRMAFPGVTSLTRPRESGIADGDSDKAQQTARYFVTTGRQRANRQTLRISTRL